MTHREAVPMPPKDANGMKRAIRVVADVTFVSGALQMVRPGLILGGLSSDPDRLGRHLFGTIGMFMTTSGATLHQSITAPAPQSGLLIWAGLQKVGASTAVAIGVRRCFFSRRALPVAAFDLASGVLCLVYARKLARSPTEG